MKLAQYLDDDTIRIGLIEGDHLLPVDFEGNMIDFIKNKRTLNPSGIPILIDRMNMAPPVTGPSKIIALGLNYKDHAEEGNANLPEAPLVFAKFPSSLIGPGETITWDPAVTQKVDYEAELAVVIGKTVKCCTEKEALENIFGYTCANDVSARDLQFGDTQWVRGKSLDTFCPLGPWITTADEIQDPHAMKIECRLNGEPMQSSHTGLLIFGIPTLVSFLSRHFTLFPGDIILTGTPSGVGAFRDPPVFMKDGDEVIVEIEGLGSLINRCRML